VASSVAGKGEERIWAWVDHRPPSSVSHLARQCVTLSPAPLARRKSRPFAGTATSWSQRVDHSAAHPSSTDHGFQNEVSN
jgi:hypothetical protein